MNILLMANWGMGLEVLKALEQISLIKEIMVSTRHEPENKDPWVNKVFNYSIANGYKTFNEKFLDFKTLETLLLEGEIDLMICHAYMKILPKKIFVIPKLGTINIHASLLPKYRGASPSRDVLLNNEKETGLTCHYIDEGIDTGDIIYQVKFGVDKDDSIDSLIEKGKSFIQELMSESLTRLNSSDFVALKQYG